MQKTEEEIARLKGHQNLQQKLQYLLAIKKENNALKEVSALNTTPKLIGITLFATMPTLPLFLHTSKQITWITPWNRTV